MSKCELCGKIFSSPSRLTYHISNNVCQKHNKSCPSCGKVFRSKQSCQYHIENNVCLNQKKTTQTSKPKLILKSKYECLTKEELIIKLSEMEGKYTSLKENPQTVNNTNQIIIVPPAFLLMDNYQELTKQLPNLLHNALSQHPGNFISYLIKETNCNPNLPLYNSVKITNKKDPFAQVSDGDKFIYASKKKIITQLIENKRQILQEYVDKNGDKYGEKILKRYQNYVDFLDDDKEAQKELEVDIICMLLNVSDLIGSDEWSKKLLEDLKVWETQTDQ